MCENEVMFVQDLEEMRIMGCSQLDCTVCGSDGWLTVLCGACHETDCEVSYRDGEIHLSCAICEEYIVSIAVAARSDFEDEDGHPLVIIERDNGNALCRRWADVNAEVHLGPRPPGHVVRHKDGNIHNNCSENLEYVRKIDLN